jgi:hypothetical protein
LVTRASNVLFEARRSFALFDFSSFKRWQQDPGSYVAGAATWQEASDLWCAEGRHLVTLAAAAGWEQQSADRGIQRWRQRENNNRGNSTRSLAG